MRDNAMLIGESFVGEGSEAAHVSTVLGRRDGPAGVAWATAQAGVACGVAGALVARDRPATLSLDGA